MNPSGKNKLEFQWLPNLAFWPVWRVSCYDNRHQLMLITVKQCQRKKGGSKILPKLQNDWLRGFIKQAFGFALAIVPENLFMSFTRRERKKLAFGIDKKLLYSWLNLRPLWIPHWLHSLWLMIARSRLGKRLVLPAGPLIATSLPTQYKTRIP